MSNLTATLETITPPVRADFGVLTVVRQYELQAMLRVLGLGNVEPNFTPEGAPTERYWVVGLRTGAIRRRLVIGLVDKAGNHPVRPALAKLIERFSPETVALVGIAAGVKEKTKLGDVVVATRIIHYEPEARRPKGKTGKRYDHAAQPEDGRLIQELVAGVERRRWRDRFNVAQGRLREDGRPAPTGFVEPKARAKYIASGEKLIEDGMLEKLYHEYDDRIRAGEMEGYGFAAEAEARNKDWLVIRGVSDHGEAGSRTGKNKDKFHDTASNAAAAWCVGWLETQLEGRTYSGGPSPVQDPWKMDGVPIQLASLCDASFWERLSDDGALRLRFVLPSGRFHGAIGQLPLVSDGMFTGEIVAALANRIGNRLKLDVETSFDIDVVQHGASGFHLDRELLERENLVLTATGDINLAVRLLYRHWLPSGLLPGPTSPDSASIGGIKQNYADVIFPNLGYLAVFRSPFNDERIVCLLGGTLAVGTLGALKLLSLYIDGEARTLGNNLEDPEVPAKVVNFNPREYPFQLTELHRATPPMELRNIDVGRLLKGVKVEE